MGVTSMKTIVMEYPFQIKNVSPSVIALGCFDGIHVAHEKLIKTAVKLAESKGIESSVMTFYPHPEEIILGKKVDYLMPLEDKQKKLAELGVHTLYLIRFNKKVSKLTPKKFIYEFLIDLKAEHVVVGFDFTYGYRAKGNIHTLLDDGDDTFGVTVIPKVEIDGRKVGSTEIRRLIKKGFVDEVPIFLGDYYRTKMSVKSKRLLRKNNKCYVQVIPFKEYQYPLQGEYVVELNVDGVLHHGIVSKASSLHNTFYLEVESRVSDLPKILQISWLRKVGIHHAAPQSV